MVTTNQHSLSPVKGTERRFLVCEPSVLSKACGFDMDRRTHRAQNDSLHGKHHPSAVVLQYRVFVLNNPEAWQMWALYMRQTPCNSGPDGIFFDSFFLNRTLNSPHPLLVRRVKPSFHLRTWLMLTRVNPHSAKAHIHTPRVFCVFVCGTLMLCFSLFRSGLSLGQTRIFKKKGSQGGGERLGRSSQRLLAHVTVLRGECACIYLCAHDSQKKRT